MGTLFRAVSLLLIVVAGALVACGGNGGNITTKEGQAVVATAIDDDFLRKANDVCLRGLARHEGQPPFPLQDFDRMDPDPEDLPILADYFERYNDTADVYRDLVALGDPESGRREWRALLEMTEDVSKNSLAQIEAATTRDVEAFVRLVEEGDVIYQRLAKAGLSAGFSASSSCGRYYG